MHTGGSAPIVVVSLTNGISSIFFYRSDFIAEVVLPEKLEAILAILRHKKKTHSNLTVLLF